jgi:alpha-tubulin suppressor-like RCC1 family protein
MKSKEPSKNPWALSPELNINIATLLSRKALSALLCTSGFFHYNKSIRDVWDAKPRQEAKIVAGDAHYFLLDGNGRLFGRGRCEQLGLINKDRKSNVTEIVINGLQADEFIQDVDTREHHSLVLTSKNRVFSCGNNDNGQLGHGDTAKRTIFKEVFINNLEEGEVIKSVCASYSHSFVLTIKGRLWGCGDNLYGQLGLGHNRDKKKFTEIIMENLGPDELIQSVCAGDSHSLVLTSKGRLFQCGDKNAFRRHYHYKNLPSQTTFQEIIIENLGPGESLQSVCSGSNYGIVLTNKGRLFDCGGNFSSPFGLGRGNNPEIIIKELYKNEFVQKIYTGRFSAFIITSRNRLFGCGYNRHGQLGLGHGDEVKVFTEIIVKDLRPGELFQSICSGNYKTFMFTDTNRLYSTVSKYSDLWERFTTSCTFIEDSLPCLGQKKEEDSKNEICSLQ